MNTERNELEKVVRTAYVDNCMQMATRDLTELMTDRILSAGYRKPRTIGYVVVSRDGCIITAVVYKDRNVAQATADEWTNDCKAGGVDWDYRVAGISEAAA